MASFQTLLNCCSMVKLFTLTNTTKSTITAYLACIHYAVRSVIEYCSRAAITKDFQICGKSCRSWGEHALFVPLASYSYISLMHERLFLCDAMETNWNMQYINRQKHGRTTKLIYFSLFCSSVFNISINYFFVLSFSKQSWNDLNYKLIYA